MRRSRDSRENPQSSSFEDTPVTESEPRVGVRRNRPQDRGDVSSREQSLRRRYDTSQRERSPNLALSPTSPAPQQTRRSSFWCSQSIRRTALTADDQGGGKSTPSFDEDKFSLDVRNWHASLLEEMEEYVRKGRWKDFFT